MEYQMSMMAGLAGSPSGHLVNTIYGHEAFVPDYLPRTVELNSELIFLLGEATAVVGKLAGVGETLPNPQLLIRPFVNNEAVSSSRIEGTVASISDLYRYQASGKRRADVLEIVNYVRALDHGLEQLQSLPICVRLMNQMHAILLSGEVRGSDKMPGNLRTGPVWIGQEETPVELARYVPPPPDRVSDLLLDLERFINDPDVRIPPLIQCAFIHYQFEAIHPYFDGNGRIGRLLIIMFLCAKGVLTSPLLYLSAYFERHRQQYYDLLFSVSEKGDWTSWIEFFLLGVKEQADDALEKVRKLRDLKDEFVTKLNERGASGNSLRLLDELFAMPMVTIPYAAKVLGISVSGARLILESFCHDYGILDQVFDEWPRVYIMSEVFNLQANQSSAV